MILFEFYTIVIPKKVLTEKYPHGIVGFATDIVNGSYSDDNELASAMFLRLEPTLNFIDFIQEKGIHFDIEEPYSKDFALISHLGPWWPSTWLQSNFSRCWLEENETY